MEIDLIHRLEGLIGTFQLIYTFKTDPIKIQAIFLIFVEVNRLFLKCKWKHKGPRIGGTT